MSGESTDVHPPMIPVFGELEPDPGCSECGACIHHDGCADEENPLQDGDCETCGACRGCIAECEQMRTCDPPITDPDLPEG